MVRTRPDIKPPFLPTPAEIKAGYERLQDGWTETERETRDCYPVKRWEAKVVVIAGVVERDVE